MQLRAARINLTGSRTSWQGGVGCVGAILRDVRVSRGVESLQVHALPCGPCHLAGTVRARHARTMCDAHISRRVRVVSSVRQRVRTGVSRLARVPSRGGPCASVLPVASLSGLRTVVHGPATRSAHVSWRMLYICK